MEALFLATLWALAEEGLCLTTLGGSCLRALGDFFTGFGDMLAPFVLDFCAFIASDEGSLNPMLVLS